MSGVLIFSARMGAGHDGAAHELARRARGRGLDATVVDFLDAFPRPLARVWEWFYVLQLRRWPESYESSYQLFYRYRALWKPFVRFERALAGRRVRRWVRDAQPDVVVSTYSFATLVLCGMLMFLVPVFVSIFDTLGGELPMLTQWVVKASNALRSYWFIIFPVWALMIWGFMRWKKTETGRQKWDAFKLRIPMSIGSVVSKIAMARWSRTLSTLVASGVDIVKALEITAQTAGNWVVEDATMAMRIRVQEGATIAQPLVESPVFPAMVSQMVKIGEETGELEKMLGKVADFYEDEVDAAVSALTAIIEPIMMIGVGLVVGVIIVAMYLPMFKMLTLIE